MQLYLILRRNGWRSPDDLQAAAARSAAEGERRPDVRWIRSYALEEGAGLGTVCICEAESPEAIRRHAAAADLPVTEIVKVADTVIARPDPTPAGEPSVGVVRGVYDAMARGDVPAMLGAMGEDIEWCEAERMPYGGVYHGGDAVAGSVLGPITSDIPDFAVTPEHFIATGDTVAVVARYTGAGLGPYEGISRGSAAAVDWFTARAVAVIRRVRLHARGPRRSEPRPDETRQP